jgi:hypothetical protein
LLASPWRANRPLRNIPEIGLRNTRAKPFGPLLYAVNWDSF